MSAPNPLEQRESPARGPTVKDTPAAPSHNARFGRRAAEGMTPDRYDRQVDPTRQPGFEEQERARRPEGAPGCVADERVDQVADGLIHSYLRQLRDNSHTLVGAVELIRRLADRGLVNETQLQRHSQAVDRAISEDAKQRSGVEDVLSLVESLLSFATAARNAFMIVRSAFRGPLMERHVLGVGLHGLVGANKGFEIDGKVGARETPQAIIALNDQARLVSAILREHGHALTEVGSNLAERDVTGVGSALEGLHRDLPIMPSMAVRAEAQAAIEAAASRVAQAEAALRAIRLRSRASQVHGSADLIPGSHKRSFLDRVMAHATASDCAAPLLLAQVHRKVARLDASTMEVTEEGTSSDGAPMLVSANQSDIEGLQAGPARRVDATHWGIALDPRDAALLRPELDAVTLERDDQVEVHFGLMRVVDAKDWQDATRREALIARWREDLHRRPPQGPQMKEDRR